MSSLRLSHTVRCPSHDHHSDDPFIRLALATDTASDAGSFRIPILTRRLFFHSPSTYLKYFTGPPTYGTENLSLRARLALIVTHAGQHLRFY